MTGLKTWAGPGRYRQRFLRAGPLRPTISARPGRTVGPKIYNPARKFSLFGLEYLNLSGKAELWELYWIVLVAIDPEWSSYALEGISYCCVPYLSDFFGDWKIS